MYLYDEESGKFLTNSIYRVHRAENPPDRSLQVAQDDENRKARTFAFHEWLDETDINYRLDHDEILNSVRMEGYCEPAVHSPAIGGRNLFVTSRGKMALGKDVRPGDVIALISGCKVPFALRPVPQGDSYTLGQPVLLPGVMSGQAWPQDDQKLEEIKIV